MVAMYTIIHIAKPINSIRIDCLFGQEKSNQANRKVYRWILCNNFNHLICITYYFESK